MPDEDFRITGVDDLERLARRLKEIGDKDLSRELRDGIARATAHVRQDIEDAAERELPKRGGLNAWVAASKFSTSVRGGKNPSVRLTGKRKNKVGKQSDLAAIDTGRVRHPVFGNRKAWVVQQVRPGFFSRPAETGAELVRREVFAVIADIDRRL